MKKLIYISGITGTLFIAFHFIGIFQEYLTNNTILISGLALLGVIFLPFMLIDKYRQSKKIDSIISSYKGQNIKEISDNENYNGTNGWSMNNSPFRERKSGLSWGGGNMRGANASRGSRKSFLK